jgi:hexulose-6-phosphate isomerase
MSPLDRRDVLRLAAALPLAQALAPPSRMQRASASDAPRKRAIRKALKLDMIAIEAPLETRFCAARDAGFDGVELPSPSELDPDEVLRARDAAGIAIPGVVDSVHWQHTLADPDPAVRARGRAALETALADCKRYGGTTVLLVPAVVGERVAYAEAWTRSQEQIRAVLPLADELGVAIAIENVWNHFLLSPLEAARYVDAFASPRVGWHLDVGNVVTYGWPEQWVDVLGKRILKLDVKEFSRARRDAEGLWKGFDVEIGAGDCGWPRVMAALDAIGWSGWAAAEVPGGGPERLREIARRMGTVLAS